MVPERDKVSSMQAYMNLCVEQFAEKVANKEVFAGVTRHQRSYYRSIYDIADIKQIGALKYDTVEPSVEWNGTTCAAAMHGVRFAWLRPPFGLLSHAFVVLSVFPVCIGLF
jgi:hypothetical protein